jgi:hypothetical protein
MQNWGQNLCDRLKSFLTIVYINSKFSTTTFVIDPWDICFALLYSLIPTETVSEVQNEVLPTVLQHLSQYCLHIKYWLPPSYKFRSPNITSTQHTSSFLQKIKIYTLEVAKYKCTEHLFSSLKICETLRPKFKISVLNSWLYCVVNLSGGTLWEGKVLSAVNYEVLVFRNWYEVYINLTFMNPCIATQLCKEPRRCNYAG